LETYAVIPGSSWGSLPTSLQREWTLWNCDAVLEKKLSSSIGDAEAVLPPQRSSEPASELMMKDRPSNSRVDNPPKKKMKKRQRTKDKKTAGALMETDEVYSSNAGTVHRVYLSTHQPIYLPIIALLLVVISCIIVSNRMVQ